VDVGLCVEEKKGSMEDDFSMKIKNVTKPFIFTP